MLVMTVRVDLWVRVLLLGHDEGDAGAVGRQRRGPLPSPAVEHGQCGQR